jgi:hypothetical protein
MPPRNPLAPVRRVIAVIMLDDGAFAVARLECGHEPMIYIVPGWRWPCERRCEACMREGRHD